MDAMTKEMNLGSTVCVQLKSFYWLEKPWPECYQDVAQKFTDLKKVARKFYADKDTLGVLSELIRYSGKDLDDMLHA
jgi:hypothetical protein